MKKMALVFLFFFSFSALADAEPEGAGFSADIRAAQAYPLLKWGEVNTITYDLSPGTGETTSKVTLSDGSFIWTTNEKARGIFCQARALNLALIVNWVSSLQYSDVAIVNPDPLGMAGTRASTPDANGWTWATVTTITYESSGAHMGSWRIVTSDNSAIWTTNSTALGIACEAYALNIPLLIQWRSSSIYDYVAIMNTVY